MRKKVLSAVEPHKYLAVYHVMSNFQYESALQEILEYNQKTESVFGLNFQGFLHYELRQYNEAVKIFNRSLDIRESIYALCKLSRAEAMLYANMPKIDPRRSSHKKRLLRHTLLQDKTIRVTGDCHYLKAGFGGETFFLEKITSWINSI